MSAQAPAVRSGPLSASAEGGVLQRALARPAAPAAGFLLVLVVFFALTAPHFLTWGNGKGILASIAVIGIIAAGVNQVILAGDIDISVGSALAVCAVAVGAVGSLTGGVVLPLLAGIAAGAAIGAVNGALTTVARIPSIVVTLGMLYALRGLDLLISGGNWITGLPKTTRILGTGTLLGLDAPIWVLLVTFLTVGTIGRYTTWGRDVMAVGGSRRAARFAGLSVDWTRFRTFVLTGALVGLAALVLVGRVGSVTTDAGKGLELQVIAAVVIGGTSITGGRGSTTAALVGTVLVGVFLNGLVLLNVPGVWQNVVLGGLILLAVSTDSVRRRLLGGRV